MSNIRGGLDEKRRETNTISRREVVEESGDRRQEMMGGREASGSKRNVQVKAAVEKNGNENEKETGKDIALFLCAPTGEDATHGQ